MQNSHDSECIRHTATSADSSSWPTSLLATMQLKVRMLVVACLYAEQLALNLFACMQLAFIFVSGNQLTGTLLLGSSDQCKRLYTLWHIFVTLELFCTSHSSVLMHLHMTMHICKKLPCKVLDGSFSRLLDVDSDW